MAGKKHIPTCSNYRPPVVPPLPPVNQRHGLRWSLEGDDAGYSWRRNHNALCDDRTNEIFHCLNNNALSVEDRVALEEERINRLLGIEFRPENNGQSGGHRNKNVEQTSPHNSERNSRQRNNDNNHVVDPKRIEWIKSSEGQEVDHQHPTRKSAAVNFTPRGATGKRMMIHAEQEANRQEPAEKKRRGCITGSSRSNNNNIPSTRQQHEANMEEEDSFDKSEYKGNINQNHSSSRTLSKGRTSIKKCQLDVNIGKQLAIDSGSSLSSSDHSCGTVRSTRTTTDQGEECSSSDNSNNWSKESSCSSGVESKSTATYRESKKKDVSAPDECPRLTTKDILTVRQVLRSVAAAPDGTSGECINALMHQCNNPHIQGQAAWGSPLVERGPLVPAERGSPALSARCDCSACTIVEEHYFENQFCNCCTCQKKRKNC